MNTQGNMGQLINLPQTYMYIYCQHLKTFWSVTCGHADTRRIPGPLSWFTDPILPVTILNYNQKKATAQIAYNPTFLTSSFFSFGLTEVRLAFLVRFSFLTLNEAFTGQVRDSGQFVKTYIFCQIFHSGLTRGLHGAVRDAGQFVQLHPAEELSQYVPHFHPRTPPLLTPILGRLGGNAHAG